MCTLMLSFSALSGCKGGGGGGGASADTGTSTAPPPVAAPTTTAAPTPATAPTEHPPVISGAARAVVKTNEPFVFAPTANDADGDPLSFQIQNKPAWATFNTVTGELAGTPGREHAGAYAGIVISTSDGKTSVALDAFTITVNAAAPSAASPVSLSWVAPTQNVDGSALTDLSGFVISFGTNPEMLSRSVFVDNPSVDTFVFDNLAPGTYYFGVRALSRDGETGELSEVIQLIVS